MRVSKIEVKYLSVLSLLSLSGRFDGYNANIDDSHTFALLLYKTIASSDGVSSVGFHPFSCIWLPH